MDYGALPPEINSGRMYAGPGSGSLVAAATAWNGLAADLHAIAVAYQSVLAGLTSGPWLGPSSIAMAAAAAPYQAWLHSSAGQAELAAGQASAAAAAHAEAFAMHVPPPVIAANRALLMALTATNFLGQNTAAIAATEAQYGEMWAQDAVAMYTYVGSSAAAATLTEFDEAPLTTDPGGLLGEVAEDGEDAGNSLGNGTENGLARLASDASSAEPETPAPNPIDDLLALYAKYIGPHVPMATALAQGTNAITAMSTFSKSLAPAAAAAKAVEGGAAALGASMTGGLGSAGLGAGGALPAVEAGLARAIPVGALSVPPSWSAATAAANPLTALRGTALGVTPAASTVNGMPMAPLGHLAANSGGRAVPQYGFRPNVIARPPSAG